MEVAKIAFLLCFTISIPCAASSSIGRPSVKDEPRFARWLVRHASWGVLSTLAPPLSDPSGYVVSYSDADTGIPYFYLSFLDLAGKNAAEDPRASLTLSERSISDCGGADAQSPLCSKVTITGKLHKLSPESWEGMRAEAALFADHPQFKGFPKSNRTFDIYKLKIAGIVLVNKPASAANLNVKEYLSIKLD